MLTRVRNLKHMHHLIHIFLDGADIKSYLNVSVALNTLPDNPPQHLVDSFCAGFIVKLSERVSICHIISIMITQERNDLMNIKKSLEDSSTGLRREDIKLNMSSQPTQTDEPNRNKVKFSNLLQEPKNREKTVAQIDQILFRLSTLELDNEEQLRVAQRTQVAQKLQKETALAVQISQMKFTDDPYLIISKSIDRKNYKIFATNIGQISINPKTNFPIEEETIKCYSGKYTENYKFPEVADYQNSFIPIYTHAINQNCPTSEISMTVSPVSDEA
jgi:hypothetical protein